MPHVIARVGREKKLRTLAERLFVIEGPGKAEKLRRAERALLRANPPLARKDAFRPGMLVLVPSDIGLELGKRVKKPSDDLEGLLQEAAQRIQLADASLHNGFEKARQSVDVALSRLQTKAFFEKLKKASPEGARMASAALPRIKDRRAAADKHEEKLAKGIEAAVVEIDKLQRLVRRS